MKNFIKMKYVLLRGLIFSCPFGLETSECPFKSIRNFPPEKRIELIDKLSENQKKSLMKYHKKCLNFREKSRIVKE